MWFKSKTQHADPQVRRRYVEQLPRGDATLLSAAIEDPHPEVRSAAVVRLEDLDALDRLARDDPDPQIRARAMARLQTVLAGGEDHSPPFERRHAYIAGCENHRLLAFVARSGAEAELRKQALAQLLANGDTEGLGPLLCDIAVDDPVADIRETAVSAIAGDEDLALLVQRSRGRDKNVYRTAQQKLERLRAQAAAQAALERCADDAQQLLARDEAAGLAAAELRLDDLEREWQQATEILDAPVASALEARFAQARDACRERFAATRELAQQRAEILAALRAHLDGEAGPPVAELSQRWHALGAASPAESRQFDKLVHEVHELDSLRDREQQRLERAEAIIGAAEQALDAEALVAADVETLQRDWGNAPKPDAADDRERLEARFDAARQKLRGRLEREADERDRQIARVGDLLDRYETALADGQLRSALSAHDKAASAIRALGDVPGAQKKLEQRLHASEPRMTELRRWRHWGTLRAREALCKRAEALADSDQPPPAIAREVRACRDEWKKLDRADGAADKPLWERFDTACEKAYAPCEEYFASQKAQRKANLERRVALCEKLERLSADTDWDAPPWRELADTVRDTQRQWHRAGPVDRREKRNIEKRFRGAVKSVETHLESKRKQETVRREALIERIENLDAEARDATRIARQAQREWKPLVQADRKTERELWTRFRAACDAVFERHKSQLVAADEERAHHLAEKKAVCDQLEQMAQSLTEAIAAETVGDSEADDAARRLKQLRTGWRRIGPIPHAQQKTIEQRFRKACTALDEVCQRARQALATASLARLAAAARDCDALELAVVSGEPVDTDALEKVLGEAREDAGLEVLVPRLERVQRAANGADAERARLTEALDDNLAAKRQLCLELEIEANIDSPPEHQSERMAWRVNQLSASMSGDRRQRNAETLQREWFATGAVPAAEQDAISRRFQRALDALNRP